MKERIILLIREALALRKWVNIFVSLFYVLSSLALILGMILGSTQQVGWFLSREFKRRTLRTKFPGRLWRRIYKTTTYIVYQFLGPLEAYKITEDLNEGTEHCLCSRLLVMYMALDHYSAVKAFTAWKPGFNYSLNSTITF